MKTLLQKVKEVDFWDISKENWDTLNQQETV